MGGRAITARPRSRPVDLPELPPWPFQAALLQRSQIQCLARRLRSRRRAVPATKLHFAQMGLATGQSVAAQGFGTKGSGKFGELTVGQVLQRERISCRGV